MPGEHIRTDGERASTPWQLRMFSKSLKKQQKLRLLLRQIRRQLAPEGSAPRLLDPGLRCLLLTHGDNNGALNLGFRAAGGQWTWVDHDAAQIEPMEQLLGETVLLGRPGAIPVEKDSFDLVVAIDVHEHLEHPMELNHELARVAAPGARIVVTTPNGEPDKLACRLKCWLGMNPVVYGHQVLGYTQEDHRRMLLEAGLEPIAEGSYSGIFTELIELAINFTYVKVLGKRGPEPVEPGTIAPTNRRQLERVGLAFRLYSTAYPLLALISRLDMLDPTTGYAVSVVARKPRNA